MNIPFKNLVLNDKAKILAKLDFAILNKFPNSKDCEEEIKEIDECKDTIDTVSLKNNLLSRILIDSKNDYFNKKMISFNLNKNFNDYKHKPKTISVMNNQKEGKLIIIN